MGCETDPARFAARAAGHKTFLAAKPCIRGHFERFTGTARCVRCNLDAKHPAIVTVRPKVVIEGRPRRLCSVRNRYGAIGMIQDFYCNGAAGRATSRRLDELIRRASGLEPAEVFAEPAPAPPIASRRLSSPGWDSAVRQKSGHVVPERTYWKSPA